MSFSSTIVFTQADGLFSNIVNTGLVFYADLNNKGKVAFPEHKVFNVTKSGSSMQLFAKVQNYGNGTPEAGLAQFSVFDLTAGSLLGTFKSSTASFTSQGQIMTLSATVALAPKTTLIDDPKIMYWDSNGNGVRDLGETVFYDNNGNGVYDAPKGGKCKTACAIDFILAGVVTPANQTALSDDPHIRFNDADNSGALTFACTDANGDPLDCTETVAFDANLNGVYDPGELVLAGPTPPTGLIVNHKYSVTATVLYDTNSDGIPDTLGVLSQAFTFKVFQ